jgi:transglutaminase-like putative cysteine protease
LDMPRGLPRDLPTAFRSFDDQLIDSKPTDGVLSYRLESFPRHRTVDALPAAMRALDLALPRARNPRSIELAQQLRAGARSDRAYVQAVLDYLQNNGFEYTLTPPKLGANSIDELLFDTRQGFCGHYASAFAMLMRAGGVPAHVVTGYLGGGTPGPKCGSRAQAGCGSIRQRWWRPTGCAATSMMPSRPAAPPVGIRMSRAGSPPPSRRGKP